MATLQARLGDLITQLGTDWKTIWAKIGTGSLNTSATTLVGAINEVKTTADSAVSSVPAATVTTQGKVELATDAEALALSDTARALTPSNLGAIVNIANGLVKLDGSGKVASAQLPAYVDDVLEYANTSSFPGTGSAGIIYVDLSTSKTYRWGGSAYAEISASPGSTDSVPEGSTNLYYTDARATGVTNARITALVGDPDTNLVTLYTAAKA
jgi:hypothetical protein